MVAILQVALLPYQAVLTGSDFLDSAYGQVGQLTLAFLQDHKQREPQVNKSKLQQPSLEPHSQQASQIWGAIILTKLQDQ